MALPATAAEVVVPRRADRPATPSLRLVPPLATRPAGRAGEVCALLGPTVYRRCLKLLRDREAARDATQEVFLRLVRDEPRLDDRADLTPWLLRVATNHCLNLLRDGKQHAEVPLDEVPEGAAPGPGDRIDALLVQRLVARFDLVTQHIALAVLVEEQEQGLVAETLGLSRRSMSRKLERFLDRARRELVLSGDVPAWAQRTVS